ncbi:MAG: TFIIB-type zinc ribbon-containing protein [Bacteroidales bacterium]|nr:TFIIB-type zinc ribbon-containing protein [Bacteroidales bacterium]
MGKNSDKKSKKRQNSKSEHPAANLQPVQGKCPKCGSSDISLNPNNGKLRCNFCHQEFEPIYSDKVIENASNLTGVNINCGAVDIDDSTADLVTIKCRNCGAEVTVDTAHSTSARCHWCRSYLSINDAIPNGAVPDMILPFIVKKDEAQELIRNFVSERKFFAKRRFKREFTADNIMGVYFPYMVVDANLHVDLDGEGGHRLYTDSMTRQDIQYYSVHRDFDISIKGLTVESAKDRLDNHSSERTNNVVNSIMPFDTDKCVKYDSNYLRGFTAEKRDMNVEDLKTIVHKQIGDISRHAILPKISEYRAGVSWKSEKYDFKGINWNAAYLPVWLYSYMDKNKKLHYVAVNARTRETCGSIPINHFKLIFFYALLAAIGAGLFFVTKSDFVLIATLTIVPTLYWAFYSIYRNQDERHYHEKETAVKLTNVRHDDHKGEIRQQYFDVNVKNENSKSINGATNR